MTTITELEDHRLARERQGLDPEAYARAAAAPIDPPKEFQLIVPPTDDIVGAYSTISWYIRETEDSFEQATFYVAHKFGLGFQHAWEQVECAYTDYVSQYSHN